MVEKIKLSPEMKQKVLNDQRTLHDLVSEYDRLEECGTDCTAYKGVIAEAQKKLERLLANFG